MMGALGGEAQAALRRAMEAAGVDPEAMAPVEPPSDEDELARQEYQAERRHRRLHGEACAVCEDDVKLSDSGILREVTGWTETIPTDGSPAAVFRPETTGGVVCGKCAESVTGARQEALEV